MSNTSIMDTLFQRTLDDLIKGIRLYSPDSSSSSLSSLVSKATEEIRREIKSTDTGTKSVSLLKLTYLNSLYAVDMSWAAFHVVEVISCPLFSVKKIGYLAATLSFNQQTDVILLLTNQLRKDLSSLNDYEVALGLHCLSVIATPDLSRDLCNDIYVLLSSTRTSVRKKAISVVFRVFRKYPDAVKLCFKRLVDNLESGDDSQAVCAVVGVFCELASIEPKAYLPLAPQFYKILLECKNNWVLIKVLKIFAKLAPLEPRLGKKIVEPICEIMRRTMAKSLLFECIRTVVSSLSDCETAVKLAVLKIKEFLGEEDPNLKYLGLQALTDIAVTHSWAVVENKEAVIKSLSDVDPNIKLASLHLLMAMVSEDNVAEITKVLLNYALKSDPEFCNEILRSILATCSKNYYEIVFDFDWYVLVLGDMSRIPHCQTGEEIEKQIVDIGMRVKDARPELVNVARDLLIDPALIGNPHLHRILSAAAWVSGEYIEFSKNLFELMEALLQPRINLLPPSIRAVYIQSVLKVLVFCLQSHLWQKDEAEGSVVETDQNPTSSINDSDFSVDKNGNDGVAKLGQPSFCMSSENASALELVCKLLDITELALGPLSRDHDVELQERAKNVLGILEFVKEAILVSREKEVEHSEITKLIIDMFSEEIGPVSVTAQARISVPDGLTLIDNLSDLDTIYSDLLLLQPPTTFSFGTSHSTPMEGDLLTPGQSKEDMHSLSKSESLLSQHRKRHDLYYLSTEKDDSPSTDYPPANDPSKVHDTEVDDLAKLTEQTFMPKKKRNHAKPRPVVVKLDEGENFIPTKKLESTEDLLSGAVREILLNNEEASTSSGFKEAAKESVVRNGKERAAYGSVYPIDNSETTETANASSKKSNRKTHGKERRQHIHGVSDDVKEEKPRKEKKKSNRHSRQKAQQKQGDSNIVVNSTIPDFLL